MSSITIYGRDIEFEQLRQMMARHRSFLLHGPAGVGKTLLMRQLADEVPELVYCDESSSSQTVFRKLAVELLARKNRHIIQTCGTPGLDAIPTKSAVTLRGIVTEALRGAASCLVIDHLNSPSQSFAVALRDLCNRTGCRLIAVARSAHMEDVGFLMPMFSDRCERFALRNFDLSRAKEFAIQTALEMRLDVANRDEAIEKIVGYSRGNPGAIFAMLQMAASPKYVAHQHLKLSPLYIDFRLKWSATHG